MALRALGLGDLLTAVPCLWALAEAFASYRRVLAITPGVAALARHVGACDEVIDVPGLDGLASALPRDLVDADVAVNLHGRGPQSHRALRSLRPRQMVAFACEEVGVDGPRWRAGEHEVARWCRMLSESGIPADPSRLTIEPPDRPVPPQALGATLLHPGAASPARRWPSSRWAAVAAAQRARGRTVVLTGNSSEVSLCREIAAAAGLAPSAVLAGTTDVLSLTAVVAAAGRVACADTGVAHLATALDRPSVVLFGPTPPSEWGPPPRRHHRALWAGQRGDPHGTHPHAGLLALKIDDVVAALDALPAPN